MIDEKARLLEEMNRARAKMQALIEKINPRQEVYPTWTIKHVLAHIAGWDEALSASLRAYLAKEEFLIPAYKGIDDYNENSVQTRRDLSYDQTVREWTLERATLKQLLDKIPGDNLQDEILYPWGQRGPISSLLRILIHHESDHADEIDQIIQRTDAGGTH